MGRLKEEELFDILRDSKNVVFFGGAGVSTASNIPDFRGANGLYSYTPEEIISHTFFWSHTKEFYQFYFDKMVYKDALPNQTHLFLAALEKIGKLKAIITQNIDGLHQKAGSKICYELHGSVLRNYCTSCRRFYSLDDLNVLDGIPRCECGGIVKPDVVLYEEGLDNDIIDKSIRAIEKCDTLIVAGTSLVVYPAAGLIRYFKGKNLIIINLGITSYDQFANLVIDGRVEDYLNLDNIKKVSRG